MSHPAVLGRYELLAHLASGGMAEVWLARMIGAKGLGRFFALKRMHRTLASQEKFVRMFLDEAEVASHVQHPNVVPIFELGEEDGELFLVMELVVGVSFSTVLARSADRGQRLPLEAVIQIVCDTALGLHAAHTATAPDGSALGIVHRDVSPQNVLVGADGRARVVDFGIAKALMRTTETQTGELKGKLSYYSPEQALAKPVDARSDVFSLGIVLWEALVGQRLFRSDSPLDTLRRITQDAIPDPAACAPVPGQVARVVLRALAREAAQRMPSALVFEAELRAAAQQAGLNPGPQHVSAIVEREAGDKIGALRSLVSRRWTQRHDANAAGALVPDAEFESASGVRMSDTLITPPTVALGTGAPAASRPIGHTGPLQQAGPMPAAFAQTGPLLGPPIASAPMTESLDLEPARRSGAPIVLAIVLGIAAAGGGGALAWVLTAGDDPTTQSSPTEASGTTLGSTRAAHAGGTLGSTSAPAPSVNPTPTPPDPATTTAPVVTPSPPAAAPARPTQGTRSARSTRVTRTAPPVSRPSPFVAPSQPPARMSPVVSDPPRPRPAPVTPAVRPAPQPPPSGQAPPRRGVVRDYD